MGKQFQALSEAHTQFIAEQKVFFVGTAVDQGRVNISPKGMHTLKVLSPHQLVWLNVTGSGNETAAHVQQNARMTIMFMALSGDPLILRVYGQAKVIHKHDTEWDTWISQFDPLPGARQIFVLNIELVQTSCGMSVPYMDYVGEREQLNDWAAAKGEAGIADYWQAKNHTSIDGLPTYIQGKGID
ncbi:pyridoxamine 5'-phosphate oxidase family protein [Methylophilus sp. UBA6697]|jgi:hypothetical protein|uniref:pyridoxamine 5'-phosphate oxidase family protein n=1 Tax=Methylophilus sp. UBA6697 TaxID=1946902 RepID=UPI000EC83954|nr:pyridoxamine 5'-phosphate oxidase family protein [Methylophilus sp. UBA6697]HCU85773.1 pyridoxamine 5'-phosphate oxidase [Methylophilus sp.]